MYAGFSLVAEVGLSLLPVGVPHDGHGVTVRVRGREAPDESRHSARVNALSRSPERQAPVIVEVTRTLCCF